VYTSYYNEKHVEQYILTKGRGFSTSRVVTGHRQYAITGYGVPLPFSNAIYNAIKPHVDIIKSSEFNDNQDIEDWGKSMNIG